MGPEGAVELAAEDAVQAPGTAGGVEVLGRKGGDDTAADEGPKISAAEPAPEIPFRESKGAYIYVTGGRDRGKTLGFVERYSLEREEWEDCPHLLVQRGSHGAAAAGGKVETLLPSNANFMHSTINLRA
mmetsp:Transcript_26697/g.41788  ORF Transcript_26697/g.41788 Transcript_26697/m.41788 type:complete len:129 (-) Transcript_26697:1081-1467(-)